MKRKLFICILSLVLALDALSAKSYKVEADRPNCMYECGETATFTVTVVDSNDLDSCLDCFTARLDNFGPHVVTNAVFDLSATNTFQISGTLSKPGFLRLKLPDTKDGRNNPSSFSVAFEPEKIRKGSPSPSDFDEFWRGAMRDFDSSVPLDPQLVQVPELSRGSFNFWRVSFAAPGGGRVYGFLSMPKDASAKKKYPVRFNVPAAGHGRWTFQMPGADDEICMLMTVHPFDPPSDVDANLRCQDKVKSALNDRFGVRNYAAAGIAVSREEYYFYRAILGINRAVDWLASRPEVDLSDFTYSGTSQGGGFGLYMMGLNSHFTKGALFVPAITDTMGYLAGRMSGWPKIIESQRPEDRKSAEKHAPYFDGANFASRISCPVRVVVGFSDTTCPPCAVYSAYNEIRVEDKGIINGIGMTHSCRKAFYEHLQEWLRETCREAEGACIVQSCPGYNAWPMIQAIGDGKLICSYSRGSGHSIGEGRRDAFARVSKDGGITWGDENVVSADPDEGEVMTGKGLDSHGAALFWVRSIKGKSRRHDLYRTEDGVRFDKIASPNLEPIPMQITDVFAVGNGLMCLWFATDYSKAGKGSWGTLVSGDDGATWTQRTIEAGLPLADLPTEPSVAVLGGRRLLCIARTEISGEKGGRQFQLTSIDDGETWHREKTSIGDIRISTPALIYDGESGNVYNYYYERGKGRVKRRTARAEDVFSHPQAWPEPEIVAYGREERPHDAGNVNVTTFGGCHYLAYYFGTRTNAAVYVKALSTEQTGTMVREFAATDIQREIDEAAAKGGGMVTVPAGRYLVGQIDLRSNVELHLEKGAVLEGKVGLENYRVTTLPYSEGTWSAIVSAIGVTNVAITGEGEIFGNGTAWPQPEDYGGNQEGLRPRGIFFADCRDVRLSDFALRDSACWGVVFKCCENVDVRRLRIDNHANANNDGIDIEARNVVIADCDIDAGDDAVCLKSNNPDFVVENVLVTNVTARSHCNALKLGTASHGAMRNIEFVDCRTEAPRRDFIDRRFGRNRPWYVNEDRPLRYPGLGAEESSGMSAIVVENVDGGTVENVLFRRIAANGTCVPVFVRAGTRSGRSCGTPPSDKYVFRNILIENLVGESLSAVASSVTGVEGCRVKGVTLRNVRIVCRGGGETAAERVRPVPEVPGKYPDAHMFGCMLPAYGLYVRHVDCLALDNVSYLLKPGTLDSRDPVVFEDVTRGR